MMKALAKKALFAALKRYAWWRIRHQPAQRPHGLPFPLVVSLTSYAKRFDTLGETLASLLSQTVKPDVTVLWLGPADLGKLPPEIRALEAKGLTIREAEDMRSYTKIIPALHAYPDAGIVTADDDVYYPAGWLAGLTEEWRAGVQEIICHRAHRMRRQGDGLAPYVEWDNQVDCVGETPNMFATGIGGVLYPPNVFHPDVTRADRFRELCPTTDDVWLNWMVRLAGTSVRRVNRIKRFREWPDAQAVGLMHVNFVEGSNNDKQIAAICAAYGVPESIQ